MDNKIIYLSEQGYNDLKNELNQLITIERPNIIRQIVLMIQIPHILKALPKLVIETSNDELSLLFVEKNVFPFFENLCR